jgi:hypothetical protein
MALSHKGVGAHFYIGLALKAIGVLTIVLSLTAFRSTMSPMPLVPVLVVAGAHWVSWRLYVHNN